MKKDDTEKRHTVPFTADIWDLLITEWVAREDPETHQRPHKIQIVREWQEDAALYRAAKKNAGDPTKGCNELLTSDANIDNLFTPDERKYVDLLLSKLRHGSEGVANMIRHILEADGSGGLDGDKGKRAESKRVQPISEPRRGREGVRGGRANKRSGER